MNNSADEYWKELFGDDYSDELKDILQKPAQTGRQNGNSKSDGYKNAKHTDDPDDGMRFNNYDIASDHSADNKSGLSRKAAEKEGASHGDSDDFKVNFDFDKEYGDVPDNRPSHREGKKRAGCLSGILYAVFIICGCLLLASLIWLAATDVLGLGNEDKKVQVTIPEGFTVAEVSDILYHDGLIKYEFLFTMYADLSHAGSNITAGTYELNTNYDYRALVNGMTAHGGKRVEVDVTIPEGFTLKQIFELFATNNVCSEQAMWDAATNYDFDYDFLDKSTLGDKHRLEGYLFPDTYMFYVGDSPNRAIEKMLDNFKAKFKAEYLTRAKEMGYSVHDIITIASMIEKEAGSDSERDLIASVIYNRLKSSNFAYLQIDATIIYVIDESGEKFSTKVDSPYNTYMHKGLPVGPIANPGINSIRAALYPKNTNYYFYALNKSKTHDFFKDSVAFNAFVNSDKYGG